MKIQKNKINEGKGYKCFNSAFNKYNGSSWKYVIGLRSPTKYDTHYTRIYGFACGKPKEVELTMTGSHANFKPRSCISYFNSVK